MLDCEELLPSPGLAARWAELLAQIRREKNATSRGAISLSVYAWLLGLSESAVVTPADFGKLQAVLAHARRPD